MDTRTGEGCRFAFIVRWLDPKSLLIWHYQLFYYTHDHSIEMFDIKNQRIFLRRVSHPEIHLEHLYIGASINLYGRQLIIESYGDEFTRKHLQGLQETSFALIKPDGIKNIGKIIDIILSNGFLIKQLRMCKLSLEDAKQFYSAHSNKPFYGALTEFMSSGCCVAMELVADDAIKRWRKLLGPTNSEEAREKSPDSIRAQFGTNSTQNACHGSDSEESAMKAMVHELASAPFIALEICNKDGQGNPVAAFREFCGPPDSQACRIIRPRTLRAKFGINKVKNGVHCTDLPEDGVLECKFIFKHSFNPFQEAMEYNNHNLR